MHTPTDSTNPAVLVSTDWVADHLQDRNVWLLEVDVDATAYERGHVAGAGAINFPGVPRPSTRVASGDADSRPAMLPNVVD